MTKFCLLSRLQTESRNFLKEFIIIVLTGNIVGVSLCQRYVFLSTLAYLAIFSIYTAANYVFKYMSYFIISFPITNMSISLVIKKQFLAVGLKAFKY